MVRNEHETTDRADAGRPLATAALALALTGLVAAATAGAAPASSDVLARMPFLANVGQVGDPDVRFLAWTFAGPVYVTGHGAIVYAVAAQGAHGERWVFRESFGMTSPRGVHPGQSRVTSIGPHGARRVTAFEEISLGEPYPGIRVTLRAAGGTVEKLFHVAAGADPAAITVRVDGVDGIGVDGDDRLILTTALGELELSAPVAYQVVDGRRRAVEVAYRVTDDLRYGFVLGDFDRRRELVIDPLLAASYLGGHNPSPPGNYDDDVANGLALAGSDVIVAGVTQSPDFPVHLGYDDTLANAYPDGFVARLDGELRTVVAATFIGTDGFDRVTDVAVDADGTVVVVGQAGYGFPVTEGAFTWSGETPVGGGFVARLSADLSELLAAAVVTPGGYPSTVALGGGGIYFGGATNDARFPITPDAFLDTCCAATGTFGIPEYNGFAGRISADLTTLEALTYLDGRTTSAIAVTPDGGVLVADGFDHAVTGTLARFDADLTTRSGLVSYYPGSTSGSSRTYFNDVAAADGYVVAVGETYMDDLPATPGAFDATCGTDGLCDGVGELTVPRSDGFVAVYSADLARVLYLTYLGGSADESVRALALGPYGEVLVAGETRSVDFPAAGDGVGAGCGSGGGCDDDGDGWLDAPDGFLARLSPDLSTLEYATVLGGSDEDRPLQVATSDGRRVWAAGRTASPDLPATPGAFDLTYNGGTADAFVALFDTGAAGTMIFADDLESGTLRGWDAP